MLALQTPVRLAAPRESAALVARWRGAGWRVGTIYRAHVWGKPFFSTPITLITPQNIEPLTLPYWLGVSNHIFNLINLIPVTI